MADPQSHYPLNSFWSRVHERSQSALRAGALQPVPTRASFIRDHGVEFVVRVSNNLLRKQTVPASRGSPQAGDPFLPPEPALTIGDLPPHHIAVLNKFNVLADHVLVITRGFAHQQCPLTSDDFRAVAAGLEGGRGLGFYNAGRTAGASQAHKHFQLVPLPLGRSTDVPTAILFEDTADGVNTAPGLRFQHAFGRLDTGPDDPRAFARQCDELYKRFLKGLGLVETLDGENARLPPYNLLLTHRWLLIVPRAKEHHLGISVNGLGFAGSLFVSSWKKLDQVQTMGPMKLLEEVSIELK